MNENNKIVVKVGGSLFPSDTCNIANHIKMASSFAKLIVVPGGGPFVNLVRQTTTGMGLSSESIYEMALLGMLQHAIALRALTGARICISIHEVLDVVKSDGLAQYIPKLEDIENCIPVDNINDSTSDSIAALLTCEWKASFVKLTDVDGIYSSDPRVDVTAVLLDEVSLNAPPRQLTCMDSVSWNLLNGASSDAWVLNGRFPERLVELVTGQHTVGTRIVPRRNKERRLPA